MHDLLVLECQHCLNFRYTFSEDGALWDWGYCALERRGKPTVAEQEAAQIEEEVRQGNRSRLLDGRFGLYKLEADDGCDLFSPRDHEGEEHEGEHEAPQLPRIGRGDM